MTADETTLWTIDDVAAYLKKSPRTVRRLAPPRADVPGQPRYEPAVIRAWFSGRRPALALASEPPRRRSA